VAPVAGAGEGDRDALAAEVNAVVGMPLDKVERLVIEANIRAFGGSLPKAARSLGVSPSTLYRKRAVWIDPLPDP
jgi:two-component system repressor protein LuxO